MIQVNVQLDNSFSDWEVPLTGSCRSQKPENTIIGYAVIQVHSHVGGDKENNPAFGQTVLSANRITGYAVLVTVQ